VFSRHGQHTNNPPPQIAAGRRSATPLHASLAAWRRTLADAFLPVGFPHSVTPDYLAYQTYDSLQAFFSTINGLLANRALLQGLGVGDASSSATFALLLTILKDMTSRVATIAFAHRFGLAIEPDAKRYRFLADFFNDAAFFMELASPLLGPWAKVGVLALGEALRAMCGVAAGASKAALSAHFAKFDNLAELNAKESSQETAVGLMGLLVGTLVVRMVESPRAVFFLVVALVLCHLWMNYLGVRSVVMDTLNRQRATIVYREWLRSGEVLAPAEVSRREAILWWTPVVADRAGQPAAVVSMAESYRDASARMYAQVREYGELAGDGKAPRHILSVSGGGTRMKSIKIMLMEGCTPRDVAVAWFSAIDIAWAEKEQGSATEKETSWGVDRGAEQADQRPLVDALANKDELCDALVKKGWNLDTQWFETGAPFRVRIVDSKRL
jgi:hypothetical protein